MFIHLLEDADLEQRIALGTRSERAAVPRTPGGERHGFSVGGIVLPQPDGVGDQRGGGDGISARSAAQHWLLMIGSLAGRGCWSMMSGRLFQYPKLKQARRLLPG